MEIILLENIDQVGRFGEQVSVKPGYARNYLFPQGKAAPATPENIARFEGRHAELAARAADQVEQARIRAEALQGQAVTIQANTGPSGKLFGSVGPADIAEALEARGLPVERSEIRMPDGPIRVVGEYTIELHLHTEFDAQVTVTVEGASGADSADPQAPETEDSGASE